MLRPLCVISIVIVSAIFSSCQPDPDPTPQTQLYLFTGQGTFAHSAANKMLEPPVFNANGIFVQAGVSAVFENDDTTIMEYRNWVRADFKDQQNAISAGSVSMNGVSIPIGQPNDLMAVTGYTYLQKNKDTTHLWNEGAANTWTVSGAGIIPQMIYTVDNSFPEFLIALPQTVATSQDLNITFNSANVQNGDFAMVTIGSDAAHNYNTSNVVPVNGATATISANGLAALAASGNKGVIGVHIYKQYLETIGGRPFAFIKLREVWGSVTFN